MSRSSGRARQITVRLCAKLCAKRRASRLIPTSAQPPLTPTRTLLPNNSLHDCFQYFTSLRKIKFSESTTQYIIFLRPQIDFSGEEVCKVWVILGARKSLACRRHSHTHKQRRSAMVILSAKRVEKYLNRGWMQEPREYGYERHLQVRALRLRPE